jgi:eukaryotic-like serine/threonine-protein kinase
VALSAGARLGPYEIISAIGAGGMGEVYRARDSRLQRDIALKILPDVFATDPERLARFEREAQVLASLNHPHIAAIHGFEESAGVRALVLELVEGETLADRLTRGPLPIDDALPIATQIAEALQSAHEQGIVHRDLKPANIKITLDGIVKVLDFGLAKLAQSTDVHRTDARPQSRPHDLTMSPTITSPAAMTGVGVLLGTAAYMSPEQAKGRDADKRSDVWAFGCVFYEMLTGRRAFEGADIGDTLASVIKGDADWSRLPPGLSPAHRTVIERCLVTDRRKRIADISVAHFLLTEHTRTAPPASSLADTSHPQPLWRRWAPIGAAIILTTAITAVAVWSFRPPPAARAVSKFSIPLVEGTAFTSGQPVAISPDGSQIVYTANQQLYVRVLSETEARPIPGTFSLATLIRFPVFSPDGQSIAFWSQTDRTLRRIPVTGGVSVPLCEISPFPMGLSWDGEWILFGHRGGVSRVSANGGKPEVLVTTKSDEFAGTPQMVPGKRAVLFSLATGNTLDRWDTAAVMVQNLESGERKSIVRGGSDARYVPTGHLVYAVGGTVRAVQFDLDRLEVTGGAVPVINGVQRVGAQLLSALATGSAYYDFSDSGSLIYVPGPTAVLSQTSLAFFDRDGMVKPLGLPPCAYGFARISPDGKRIAYGTDDGKEADVWVYELSGQAQPRRLTFGGANRFPIWSADGARVAFQSDREGDRGIWWQPVEGGTAARLTTPEDKDVAHVPDAFSPDRQSLSFTARKGETSSAIWLLSLTDKRVAVFSTSSTNVSRAAFSPDGRWLAYQSSDAATAGVLVEPFPPTGTVNQVARRTAATPHHPFWSHDGSELFYLPGPNAFAVVRVTTQSGFSVSNSVSLPRGVFLEGGPDAVRNLDVLPDGRFIGIVDADQSQSGKASAPQINVVLNWFDELKRQVPTK